MRNLVLIIFKMLTYLLTLPVCIQHPVAAGLIPLCCVVALFILTRLWHCLLGCAPPPPHSPLRSHRCPPHLCQFPTDIPADAATLPDALLTLTGLQPPALAPPCQPCTHRDSALTLLGLWHPAPLTSTCMPSSRHHHWGSDTPAQGSPYPAVTLMASARHCCHHPPTLTLQGLWCHSRTPPTPWMLLLHPRRLLEQSVLEGKECEGGGQRGKREKEMEGKRKRTTAPFVI